jgi:hypothetical protein
MLRCNKGLFLTALFFLVTVWGPQARSVETGRLTLEKAVMCEQIEDGAPVNETVVFSLTARRAICFTSFSAVPGNIILHHNWYMRDRLRASVRLRLQPPQWDTYSSIPLKETDKGPWRVEIIDPNDNVLQVLRFSITD